MYILDQVIRWTYFAFFVRKSHVGVPDLEAVSEPRESHLLDLNPKIGLQTLHHLENVA